MCLFVTEVVNNQTVRLSDGYYGHVIIDYAVHGEGTVCDDDFDNIATMDVKWCVDNWATRKSCCCVLTITILYHQPN